MGLHKSWGKGMISHSFQGMIESMVKHAHCWQSCSHTLDFYFMPQRVVVEVCPSAQSWAIQSWFLLVVSDSVCYTCTRRVACTPPQLFACELVHGVLPKCNLNNTDFTILSLEILLEQSACIDLCNRMGLGSLDFAAIQVPSEPKAWLWVGLASNMTRSQP